MLLKSVSKKDNKIIVSIHLDYYYNLNITDKDIVKFIKYISNDKKVINYDTYNYYDNDLFNDRYLNIIFSYNKDNTIKKLNEYFKKAIRKYMLDINNINLDFRQFIQIYYNIDINNIYSSYLNIDRKNFLERFKDDIYIYYYDKEGIELNNIDTLEYMELNSIICDIVENKLYLDYTDYKDNNLIL